MTRMTGPDCAVMYNLINIHTYILINTYIHTYMHTYIHTYIHTYVHTYIHTYIHTAYLHTYIQVSLIPPWEDQCE